MTNAKRITILMFAIIFTMSFAAGCGNSAEPTSGTTSAQSTSTTSSSSSTSTEASDSSSSNSADNTSSEIQKVQIEMDNGDKMVFELYPQYAPETVNNFIKLAESGFYDGLTFHRIVKGFMIQGGDPKGDGTGGADQTIKGEFASNGFTKNTLSHTKGVISMARSQENDSASSQFFIMNNDEPGLDGNYAAFGKLVEGEDVLDKLSNTTVQLNEFTGEQSQPVEKVVIKKVTVLK